MAKDSDLEIGLGRRALVRPEQTEDAAQEKVEERPDHGAAFSQIHNHWAGLPGGNGFLYTTRSGTWIEFVYPTGCTDNRLKAIAPYYGAAPKPREAIRRLCPVVGSWPDKDFTTKAAAIPETNLTEAGVPHDLKVYPGTKHAFFNDTLRTYNAGAAADSWQRVLAFFEEHVEGTSRTPSSEP